MSREPLSSRLLIGAIAGFVATAAMTAAMRRMHGLLPPAERYPLPPREITETIFAPASEAGAEDLSLAAHFAFGAAAGALLTATDADVPVRRGIVGGLALWTASYFGWVPAVGILTPAHRHPLRRNALMVAAHLVWGAVAALTAQELVHSRDSVVKDGPLRDRPATVRRRRA
ncbi:MAG TPA: hypothetical protein VEB68_10825 [Croceibacterium sp.]|nr:hypothetical protein [Croceibacterium sp.]